MYSPGMKSVSVVRYKSFVIEIENELHSQYGLCWKYSLYYLFNNQKYKLSLTPNLARLYTEYEFALSLAKGEIDNHLDELTPVINEI
jgi:hypothetical protein